MHFAPDPNNTSFPTKPVFVESRLVRDVTEFPTRVNYLYFDDVVETVVRFGDDQELTVHSKPFNEEMFFVQWSVENHKKTVENSWPGSIEVNPSLKNKVWVVASRRHQLSEQKAA